MILIDKLSGRRICVCLLFYVLCLKNPSEGEKQQAIKNITKGQLQIITASDTFLVKVFNPYCM